MGFRPSALGSESNSGYGDGEKHVNTIESAWALFKRGLIGVYHHVSATHLQEYLDGFAFRWSHRHEKPEMMRLVLASCAA